MQPPRFRLGPAASTLAAVARARAKQEIAASDQRESNALRTVSAVGGPRAPDENPLVAIASGLAGAAYDQTVGLVGNIGDVATHLDRIPGNANLIGIALTHLDLTAQVASADFANGVTAFGQMSLADKVRFGTNVLAAALGPKVIGRVGGALRGGEAAEAASETRIPALACGQSFSADTPVATAAGAVAIGSLVVGDQVLAYDPQTGTTESHRVDAVLVHSDPAVEHLVVDGDSIDTTPDHPFLTADRGWVEARDLRVGEPVWSADGSTGAVASLTIDEAPAQMWDLTVADAHTFFVGAGAWLVHNCGFNTFDQAKAALGPAGDGMVYDHVVEQSQIVKSGFDPQVVHSAANLRPVPASINAAKAAYYASKQPFSNGLRVRDWLAGQDFATQREFGLDVLRELLNE